MVTDWDPDQWHLERLYYTLHYLSFWYITGESPQWEMIPFHVVDNGNITGGLIVETVLGKGTRLEC